MKSTVARKRTRFVLAGLSVAVLGAFLYWGLQDGIENPEIKSANANLQTLDHESDLVLSQAPFEAPDQDLLVVEEDEADESNLPADAGIYPVARMEIGGAPMDVVAGEVVAKFDPAISTAGRDRLVARLGSAVLLDDPITGYVRLKVPENETIQSFGQLLNSVDGVITALPNVMMKATANRCTTTNADYYSFQWNLAEYKHAQVCSSMSQDPAPVVVAILDSGCAYEVNGSDYAQALELADIPILAPYDFVNDDANPDDDNGHGTHIASIALGLGKINGVTPGATLMPVKVLDAKNQGTELALAQGIRHAVDNGADLINMSLSFPPRYVPSALLSDAVAYAKANGVMMLASSGNNGKAGMPYPSQYNDVLSIGAVRMKRIVGGEVTATKASYSAYGAGLDAVTWGGDLHKDANHDGYPDGILGPSIRKNDPSQIRYVFYVGTSQASAQATGIATWLMAAGANAEEARDAMLQTAIDLGKPGYDKYYGQGLLSLEEAVSFYNAQLPTPSPELHVNVLPVVYKDAGNEWGVARVKVTDAYGNAMADAEFYGQWTGAVSSEVEGITDANGEAVLASEQVADDDVGSIFGLEISSVVDPVTGRTVRPAEFYYMGEGFEAMLEGTLSEGATQGSLIALHVEAQDQNLSSVFDTNLLAECFTVKGLGPSLSTPSIGLTFTPDLIPGLAEGTLGYQEIVIEFGSEKAFGHGKKSNGMLKVYSGGVGMALSTMNPRGVGMALSTFNKLGSGVGMALSTFGRLGGVGMALSTMSVLRVDSSIITGQTVEGPAEFVRLEDPDSFLSANPHIENTALGYNLEFTRFAANCSDSAALDAVMAGASAEEVDAELAEFEQAQTLEEVSIEDAPAVDASQAEEDAVDEYQ